MPPELRDVDGVAFYSVDDPVGVVDPTLPESREVAFERLRFADSLEGAPLDVFQESPEPLRSSVSCQ